MADCHVTVILEPGDAMKAVLINSIWLGLWIFTTACDTNLKVTVSSHEVSATDSPEPEQATKTPIATKLSASDCVDPSLEEIPVNVSFTLCNGELAQGLLQLPQECTADGMTGCITNDAFKSADMTLAVASNIKNGATVAGISGSVAESPAPCATDGGVGCVVIGPTFKAASMGNFSAGSIRSGVTVAGVAGSLSDCSANNVAGCVTTSTYKSADLTNLAPGNIKDAVTIAGVAGTLTFSGPGNCGADGEQGCVTTPLFPAAKASDAVASNIKSGVTVAGTLGTYGPTCASDGAGSCLVDGTTYKAAAMVNVVDSNIKSGVTIAGVVGNVTPSPGACGSDGASSCVVDGTTYKAAAMANAVPANIRSGATIAGVTGGYPSASHRLAGADGTADLDGATFNAKIKSSADFEWFDSAGARYTHAGEPKITAGLLLSGVTIFGTVGTFVPGSMSVSSLSATRGTGKVVLSWTRSGGTGVIIVRRASGSVSFTPSHGTNYNQGYSSGSDEVVYKGSAATFDDTTLSDGTTYYYKAFVYNTDNAYSPASNQASVLYTDGEVCGDLGDSCYDHTAAKAAGLATTPLGKNLEYVTASGGFKVWKEVGSNKILRANGLDEWAKKLNLDGKGFTAIDFTDYTSLEGRKCPPNVYIDDSNKVSSGNCLYYSVGYAAQALSAAGTSQTTASQIGLNNWSNYNGGGAKWYVGNIKTCSDKGMRLPTSYETTVTSFNNYPSDASPQAAGANGIPYHASGYTWTATAATNGSQYYAQWGTGGQGWTSYSNAVYVRCALP